MRRLLLPVLLLAACGGNPEPDVPGAPAAPAAPWSRPALARAEAPRVLLEQWQRAENREQCAPLAPASLAALGRGAEAQPRAATFAGGWGVAWDLPGVRSAFGVAGAGVAADAPAYHEWPHQLAWADGSTAGYGPEGGSGPNQLAYLRVAGQGCLYNVWSRLGREHLEALLGQLRRVQTGS